MPGLQTHSVIDILLLFVGVAISTIGTLALGRLNKLQKDIDRLFELFGKVKSQHDTLQGEHNAIHRKLD